MSQSSFIAAPAVQSSFFPGFVPPAWHAPLFQVFGHPKAPCHSLTFAAGGAAVLSFGGASRFARASACAQFLRGAGLACVVSSLGGGVSLFVGPSPAAVVSSFPWLVSRG